MILLKWKRVIPEINSKSLIQSIKIKWFMGELKLRQFDWPAYSDIEIKLIIYESWNKPKNSDLAIFDTEFNGFSE